VNRIVILTTPCSLFTAILKSSVVLNIQIATALTPSLEIAMNSSNMTMCSYEPFSCYCIHTPADHALVRCGHPNDRPIGHPLYPADDALHYVWCILCKTWCFNLRNDCPLKLNGGTKTGDNAQDTPAPEKKDRSTCSRL